MAKTIFITGATSGIGQATAVRLARERHNLILTGRRGERLEKLKNELTQRYGCKVHTLGFDVRRRDEIQAAVEQLPAEWQRIDVLVNNAGLAVGLEPLHEGIADDWERMIDTNIKGLLYVTRAIAPGMVGRRSGHIVNLGSVAGKDVYPGGAVYCATKHAVDALSKGMRMDFLPYGIRVTQICPGAVETEFSVVRFKGDCDRADKVYEGYRALSADDIAEAICYALSQPEHVDVQDVLVLPAAQADGKMFHRMKA